MPPLLTGFLAARRCRRAEDEPEVRRCGPHHRPAERRAALNCSEVEVNPTIAS